MESGRKTSKNFKKKGSKKLESGSKTKTKTKTESKLGRTKTGKLKVLPPINNTDIHLSDYGYSLDKTQTQRKTSLKRASKKEGTLKVLRRLNLIRNYTAVKTNKQKMSKDMEFMKDQYKKSKK
jgi:hypothetical protein